MRKILVLNGSPRASGNTSRLVEAFCEGVEATAEVETAAVHALNIKACTGCLRCNVLKRCSLNGDDWEVLATKILASDVLVFAAPVYFHHLPGPLKTVLDRFRSFTHVQITEDGLKHSTHRSWARDFVLLLSQGSSDPVDSQPIIDLFTYICRIMGPENSLHSLVGTRLAMSGQVSRSEEELRTLYRKMQLPEKLAKDDYLHNQDLLAQCRRLGLQLGNR